MFPSYVFLRVFERYSRNFAPPKDVLMFRGDKHEINTATALFAEQVGKADVSRALRYPIRK